jgi:hypothetical protein
MVVSPYQHKQVTNVADKRKGKVTYSASDVSSEDDLDQHGRGPVSRPLDDTTQGSALDTSEVWYDEWDLEFGQILGQQFLDPEWLQ